MHAPAPTATYRFQLTPTFGFDRVAAQLGRLQALGVSHVYLSPITEADTGQHPRLRRRRPHHGAGRARRPRAPGGVARRLRRAGHGRARRPRRPTTCRSGDPSCNRQWWAMLRDGPASAAGGLVRRRVDGSRRQGHPARPRRAAGRRSSTASSGPVTSCTSARSAGRWRRAPSTCRSASCSTGSTTACSSGATRPATSAASSPSTTSSPCTSPTATVAAVVDTVPRLLTGHEAFAGVRVDHVDGLADPRGTSTGCATVIGDRWLVVEKILAAGEVLPPTGRSTGTTGYEHATVVEHAMLDAGGWGRLRERWTEVVGDARPFRDVGAAGPPRGPRPRPAAGPRAGHPGRRRRRRGSTDVLEAGRHRAEHPPRALPHVPPGGRRRAGHGPRRGRRRPTRPGRRRRRAHGPDGRRRTTSCAPAGSS